MIRQIYSYLRVSALGEIVPLEFCEGPTGSNVWQGLLIHEDVRMSIGTTWPISNFELHHRWSLYIIWWLRGRIPMWRLSMLEKTAQNRKIWRNSNKYRKRWFKVFCCNTFAKIPRAHRMYWTNCIFAYIYHGIYHTLSLWARLFCFFGLVVTSFGEWVQMILTSKRFMKNEEKQCRICMSYSLTPEVDWSLT